MSAKFHFHKLTNQRGFSHVELLIAITVIGLIAFVGVHVLTQSHAYTGHRVLWGESFGGSSVTNIKTATSAWSNATVGRYYFSGDPKTYSTSSLTSIPSNETIFVSFKTSVASVASGSYNATFATILKSWNNSGRTIYWTWQHEPDDPTKNIAPAQFVAGFNQLLSVERANPSPNVKSMSILMAYALAKGQPHGNPDSWYVNTDVLGFDCYQLKTELLAEAYATSKGKALAFPEVGDGIKAGQTDFQANAFAHSFNSALTPNVFAAVWYNAGVNKLAPWPNTLNYLKTLP